jgi:hypothetical protein
MNVVCANAAFLCMATVANKAVSRPHKPVPDKVLEEKEGCYKFLWSRSSQVEFVNIGDLEKPRL